jgi:hypothetical protein
MIASPLGSSYCPWPSHPIILFLPLILSGMSSSRTGTHQVLLVVGALALAGGLYALPKGIVKPKESKAELNQDAARTANRDGGGMATNGSKTEASSGPRPAETATVGPDNPEALLLRRTHRPMPRFAASLMAYWRSIRPLLPLLARR